ncbi:membrane-binding protein [uncultured Flavobacterium sp.]|uniref:toxin-antitoxin system YwqK family antitoxin n=1 Tax=uncultured Flavobacterium sp. TaxID=165435 RepID=UPI0025E89B62|nr:membrane-binding protein [uncultured Flavobacterium sp.]
MKKIMFAAAMLTAGVLSAQEVKPKHEIQDQMVKSTYYYENGQVKQQGFYKDGKLHGIWTSFNEDGTKRAMGEYNSGVKTGKWFFWTGSELNEVDYADSRIAEVKKWSQNAVVINK